MIYDTTYLNRLHCTPDIPTPKAVIDFQWAYLLRRLAEHGKTLQQENITNKCILLAKQNEFKKV